GLTTEQAQFQNGPGAGATWKNVGAFAVGSTAPVLYGYAHKKAATGDISNMSPPSIPITPAIGSAVVVQGDGETNPQPGDTVIIYRTPQGGSDFLYLAEIPEPAAGTRWTFTDTL